MTLEEKIEREIAKNAPMIKRTGFCAGGGFLDGRNPEKNFLRTFAHTIVAAALDEEHARFIADLYIIRSKTIRPLNPREQQSAEEVLQYNWLNVLIANLSDKYNVKYDKIKDAIREKEIDKRDEILKSL